MEYKPRLIQKYKEEIVPALLKQFGYKSIMQVPQLKKISINQGLGAAITDKKMIDTGIEQGSGNAVGYMAFPFSVRIKGVF